MSRNRISDTGRSDSVAIGCGLVMLCSLIGGMFYAFRPIAVMAFVAFKTLFTVNNDSTVALAKIIAGCLCLSMLGFMFFYIIPEDVIKKTIRKKETQRKESDEKRLIEIQQQERWVDDIVGGIANCLLLLFVVVIVWNSRSDIAQLIGYLCSIGIFYNLVHTIQSVLHLVRKW